MATFLAPTSLILLAQTGDHRALEELFRGIESPLLDYLTGLLGDTHAAEDALQEVFVLLWRKLPWLRDPQLFRPWAYRIANREGFRRLRRERFWSRMLGHDELELTIEVSTPDFALPESMEQVSLYLAALSPASRAVVALHYQQGLTIEEVATVLELPTGTVKSRLAYALSVLRQKFAHQETDDD